MPKEGNIVLKDNTVATARLAICWVWRPPWVPSAVPSEGVEFCTTHETFRRHTLSQANDMVANERKVHC